MTNHIKKITLVCLHYLIIILASACVKDGYTSSNTIYLNQSGIDIQFIPYSDGAPQDKYRFELSNTKSHELDGLTGGGKSSGSGFGEDALVMYQTDSILIIFNNKYLMTHFTTSTVPNGQRGYSVTSKRNIFNRESYKIEQLSKKKHINNWLFTYTFTEEDYLDAKERGREVTP